MFGVTIRLTFKFGFVGLFELTVPAIQGGEGGEAPFKKVCQGGGVGGGNAL